MKKKKLSDLTANSIIDSSDDIVILKGTVPLKSKLNQLNDVIAPIGFNLLIASGTNAFKVAGDGKIDIVTRSAFYPLIAGVIYTLVFNYTNWGGGAIGIKVGTTIVNSNVVSNNDSTTVYVFKCPESSNSLTFYHNGSDSGNSHVRWSCLYQGNVNPPKAYKKSLGDL